MRISFENGGYFTIKRVKWDTNGQMFMDYFILIESVTDPIQFELLKNLDLKSK